MTYRPVLEYPSKKSEMKHRLIVFRAEDLGEQKVVMAVKR